MLCSEPKGVSTCRPLWVLRIYHRITITAAALAAAFFCLLPLAACKRIHVFLEGDLVAFQVFFQLVLDILLDHFHILSYRVHKVSSAPEISVPVIILQIGVPVENHQRTIAPERPHEPCDTHVRRDTHQKMKVIRARSPSMVSAFISLHSFLMISLMSLRTSL